LQTVFKPSQPLFLNAESKRQCRFDTDENNKIITKDSGGGKDFDKLSQRVNFLPVGFFITLVAVVGYFLTLAIRQAMEYDGGNFSCQFNQGKLLLCDR